MSTKVPKETIEEYFKQNASRAVDVIFSENKLEQIHEIYSSLLEHKKNNTQSLKQTLSNNYDRMLYCSDLLEQTKKYATLVKEVSDRIDSEIIVSQQESTLNQKQKTFFVEIETLTRQKHFYEAIKHSNQDLQLSTKDRYYLTYAKIEIINKLEKCICVTQFTQSKLEDYQKCLTEFAFEKEGDLYLFNSNHSEWLKDFKPKSLFGLLYKKHLKITNPLTLDECKSFVYETLFEFKLLTLKNKFNINFTSKSFEDYFNELGSVLSIYSKLKNTEKLCTIFNEATPQFKSQLASIFIEKKSSGEIVFKCDLYDELIKSESFESSIENFYQKMSESGIEINHPFKFVKELWYNYFINLIDLSFEQTSPLLRISSLKQNSLNAENIPEEMRKYLYDYSLEQSLHIITEYEEKIIVMEKNILPIISRCTETELKSFKEKVNEKITEISQRCSEFSEKSFSEKPSCLDLRKYLLLRTLCEILCKKIEQIGLGQNITLNYYSFTETFSKDNLSKYWNCFISEDSIDDSEVEEGLIKLDMFFIGYVEGSPEPRKNILRNLISEISLQILEHIYSQAQEGREKNSLEHTIASLKQKKEKITILCSIAVPYLASAIFQCQMRPVCMDKDFYAKNFICKESQPIMPVQITEEEDDFEIGEKEEKEEFVKVNIGKSILNYGNNIMAGFMPKKK